MKKLDFLREQVRANKLIDESALLKRLLAEPGLNDAQSGRVQALASELVVRCREKSDQAGSLDAFLQEFGLGNEEGIALMCLAESLLRIPDGATADKLIAEKIQSGDWSAHRGRSDSTFVNASVWGLMLTGKIVGLDGAITQHTNSWLQRLMGRLGEPVVRQAMLQAMRILGGQYVLGERIQAARSRGAYQYPLGTRFSFDMLGEGARTAADAERYFESYADAIRTLASAERRESEIAADGVSVKLSALHPRFEPKKWQRVEQELYPRVLSLCQAAARGGIGLNIDAEECDRLEMTMSLFERLAREPDLAGWQGLGFVLQAYQKRALYVADWLVELARDADRAFTVRLVKGAYWDTEIKRAQQLGLSDFPVFTRKCHTDLSYHRCAQRLLEEQTLIYPQFATHNAYTIALVAELGAKKRFELQRLHGMGALLYEELSRRLSAIPVRVYAPVGPHRDLLPYLVRRLLENGANSSFVNRFLDAKIPVAELLEDSAIRTMRLGSRNHPEIAQPTAIQRDAHTPFQSAAGIDLSCEKVVQSLEQAVVDQSVHRFEATSIVGHHTREGACGDGGDQRSDYESARLLNPAKVTSDLGSVSYASRQKLETAFRSCAAGQRHWDRLGVAARAICLERAAELLEQRQDQFVGLLVLEAGRTIDDGVDEVREAVDFLRYYAAQGRELMLPQNLCSPAGETNRLSLHGRGTFVCISPWNFPLAIFTGQVAAALITGNAVVAKPAEQTPMIAMRMTELLLQAGVPEDALQLLQGKGAELGAALVADERTAGVVFTGSVATAASINRALAARPGPIAPLIAETGGLNTMIVDSTALPEQVIDDVIRSAFQSAGQRCSALRVLLLQEDIAEHTLSMLAGAMAELELGDPAKFATDIGPLIDQTALDRLRRHCARMDKEGRLLIECGAQMPAEGLFFSPRVYEVPDLSSVGEETFGPILHVLRYQEEEIDRLLADIRASHYGLTLGVHSRLQSFADYVFENSFVGNVYVNRDIIGAAVGVNPFGGLGHSGTGPKAGGPHYLGRFVAERTLTDNVVAKGGNAQLFSLRE
ncbi:MAG: bifunctional proline dehydrogenase/L-glutamate gamma-semialdehyde dehydrogenase PutA [Pseudomonadota bacterium]